MKKIKEVKNKNKGIIYLAIIAIFIFAFILYSANNGYTEKKAVPKSAMQSHIDEIKKNNRETVETAKNNMFNIVRPIDEGDHYWGELGAPVEIIVYSDFDCEFCGDFISELDKARKEYGSEAVIAFRHYPLRSHAFSYSAAIASECASEDGKFWQAHDALFSLKKENNLNDESILSLPEEIGINKKKFTECINSESYKDKVDGQYSEAVSFNVTGSPTIFVNTQPLPGAYPFEDFTDSTGQKRMGIKSIIEKHLSASEEDHIPME